MLSLWRGKKLWTLYPHRIYIYACIYIYIHSHIYVHISILVCMYVLSSHLLAGMNMLPRPIPAVLTCHVCHINKSPQEEYDLHLHSVSHRIKSLWYHGCPMVICNGCRVVLSGSVAEHEASAKHVWPALNSWPRGSLWRHTSGKSPRV